MVRTIRGSRSDMAGPSESIRYGERIVYVRRDEVELAGDLYLPAAAGPHPVVLAVPGGGWRNGHRGGLRHWGEYLARNGYAVFSVDYRQATIAPSFPHAVQDVVAAAQFLCGEGQRFGLDSERLILLGASAGAHVAALAALAGERPPFLGGLGGELHSNLRPQFRALIVAYGIYDLFAHWQSTRQTNPAPEDDVIERFLGCSPFDDPDLYTLASPLRHVAYRRNGLKVFLTWGTHDTAVDPRQSEAFRLALEQARFYVRAVPVVGAGHFWFSEDPVDDPLGFTACVGPAITRFLTRVTGAQGAAD